MPFGENGKNMQWHVDVLYRMQATILEGDLHPVAHLFLERGGHRYAAWIGQRLCARRNIDAVAEYVIAVQDDIADIQPDAEFEPLVLR